MTNEIFYLLQIFFLIIIRNSLNFNFDMLLILILNSNIKLKFIFVEFSIRFYSIFLV